MNAPRPPDLSPEGVQQLQRLIERIERHEGPWGVERGGERTGENTVSMPWVERHPLATEAMTFLYDHAFIIPFQWYEWDEGRELLRRPDADTLATLDRQTVAKLFTAVARNDRFSEGAWIALFEAGTGLALFRRLLAIERSAPRACPATDGASQEASG